MMPSGIGSIVVRGDIAKSGQCRGCKGAIVWRVRARDGKFLPFNGKLEPLHVEIDEASGVRLETLAHDDLHFLRCVKRVRS
jgi:hypothetical protein